MKSQKTRRINQTTVVAAGVADNAGLIEAGDARNTINVMHSQFHITESLIPVRITLSNLIYAHNIPHPIKSR